MELRRGDLIEVQWLDIFEDPVGNPDAGEVATRLSIGYFWGVRQSAGIDAFITTTTIDVVDEGTNGYCCYPLAVIADVKLIKRGRGKRYKASPVYEFQRRILRPQHKKRSGAVNSRADQDVPAPEAARVGSESSGIIKHTRDPNAPAVAGRYQGEAEGTGRAGDDHSR